MGLCHMLENEASVSTRAVSRGHTARGWETGTLDREPGQALDGQPRRDAGESLHPGLPIRNLGMVFVPLLARGENLHRGLGKQRLRL